MTVRRDFLGFTAGAAAAGTVLPAMTRAEGRVSQVEKPSPDAALIALADRCNAARAAHAGYRGPDFSPEDERLYDDYMEAFRAVLATPARTLEGLAAKARVSLAESLLPDGAHMEPDQGWDKAARSIVEDLARLTGGAS